MERTDEVAMSEETRKCQPQKNDCRNSIVQMFLKAVAVFLAVALIYGTVYIAFGKGRQIFYGVYTDANTVLVLDETSKAFLASDATLPVEDDARIAADVINQAMSAVPLAGYRWSRNCAITKDISVGSATDIVNRLIRSVKPDMDLNAVVGKFIDTGACSAELQKGSTAFPGELSANYLLTASSLQGGDLLNLQSEGETYHFSLPDAVNPQRDRSTAYARLINDYVTQQEIEARIAQELPSYMKLAVSVENVELVYQNIQVEITVTSGKVSALSYSYDLIVREIKMNIATATGEAHVAAAYTDFVY